VVNAMPSAVYPWEGDPVTIIEDAGGWTPGQIWRGADVLASTGIRSPVRPANSERLCKNLGSNLIFAPIGPI
jgi:hypothetical protein